MEPDPQPSFTLDTAIVREFPDRGLLWLLANPSLLKELLQLAAPALAHSFDFARAAPVNRSHLSQDLTKQETDILYRLPFRTGAISVVW